MGDGLIAQLRGLGPLRLALLGGAGLAVLGLIAWFVLRAGQPPMALLYGELDPRDAGQVVAALERARVPFRIEAGGTRILAPEDQVPRLRLTLAREGLPQGGSVGYEIFDRGESLTTTPFQQDVNRLRALEGEIARSIRQLSGVRGARVHLVLPRRDAFSRDRGAAQASVVLTMQGAQRLDREGVQAVLHLVATAVPGLAPQNVSIVDSRGALLARGGQALAGPGRRHLAGGDAPRAGTAHRPRGGGNARTHPRPGARARRGDGRDGFRPRRRPPRNASTPTTRCRAASNPARNPRAARKAADHGAEQRARMPTPMAAPPPPRKAGRRRRPISRSAAPPATPCANIRWSSACRSPCWSMACGRRRPAARPPSASARAEEIGAHRHRWCRARSAIDERRGDRVQVVSLRFAEPPAADAAAPGMFDLNFSSTTIARLTESAIFALVALLAHPAGRAPGGGRGW